MEIPRGPVRRMTARRRGLEAPPGLHGLTVRVGATERVAWFVPGPSPGSPLVVALHGAGGTGAGMAALTRLSVLGPAAGFAVVFPDGVRRVWHDARDEGAHGRRADVDDVGFLRALVAELERRRIADPRRVFLTGISNGSILAEHVARHALLDVRGLALVAGYAVARSRAACEVPRRPCSVAVFAGTADPLVPYAGGAIGPLGRVASRRDPEGRRGIGIAATTTAADWAVANGAPPAPRVDRLAAPGDLRVERRWWQAVGGPPTVLYTVEGGGHTWPGGPAYLPERVIGRVARSLDASALVLEQFAQAAR